MVSDRMSQCGLLARFMRIFTLLIGMIVLAPLGAGAAPYAAMVIDARSGEVLHSSNADTRLHPASLTKMMTLYIAFEAVEHGEISLDTYVTISSKAASEPPSKLGLKAGQKIKLRYLMRAAAVKSANDAATAIGEAISGSEAAFARRMNRTAKAMGMTRTTFKNANGLTESGHLSTARDMSKLGRHVFYDYPEYYNLFSRRTADAKLATVSNTNRRFLDSYKGADGIKTGYTNAAGFNLVASAERGGERIIATVFGGRSTASRNQRVAELLDLGFSRAKTRVAVNKPRKPAYKGNSGTGGGGADTIVIAGNSSGSTTPGVMPAGKIVRVKVNVTHSPRPRLRPGSATPPPEMLLAMKDGIKDAVALAAANEAPAAIPAPEALETAVLAAADAPAATPPAPKPQANLAAQVEEIAPRPAPKAAQPRMRPAEIVLASTGNAANTPVQSAEPIVVTRMSTSGGRHWGINVGRYGSQYQAERVLLKTALNEMGTLDEALRKVVKRKSGFDANFVGMTEETATLACRRLQARQLECHTFGPS